MTPNHAFERTRVVSLPGSARWISNPPLVIPSNRSDEGISMKVSGRCHCGAITYEAIVDPQRVAICHCADCQRLTGSAYRVSVPAVPDSFSLMTGSPAVYVKRAESGAKRAQAFCPVCGSP